MKHAGKRTRKFWQERCCDHVNCDGVECEDCPYSADLEYTRIDCRKAYREAWKQPTNFIGYHQKHKNWLTHAMRESGSTPYQE